MLEARVARTREGHPQHTALLGEWAIGKTTLLMHWRRRLEEAGDRVVLTMAYPQSGDDFFARLAGSLESASGAGWTTKLDLELGELTIISCNGTAKIPYYQLLCRAFEIPFFTLFDLDGSPETERARVKRCVNGLRRRPSDSTS